MSINSRSDEIWETAYSSSALGRGVMAPVQSLNLDCLGHQLFQRLNRRPCVMHVKRVLQPAFDLIICLFDSRAGCCCPGQSDHEI